MIDYYGILKKYFKSTKNEKRLKELESIKNDNTKVIKLYNRFKSMIKPELKEFKFTLKKLIIESLTKEKIPGGLAKGKTLEDIAKKHDPKGYYSLENTIPKLIAQLVKGEKVEMEHTNDIKVAREIAMDHLWEDPNYYDKLDKIEKK